MSEHAVRIGHTVRRARTESSPLVQAVLAWIETHRDELEPWLR